MNNESWQNLKVNILVASPRPDGIAEKWKNPGETMEESWKRHQEILHPQGEAQAINVDGGFTWRKKQNRLILRKVNHVIINKTRNLSDLENRSENLRNRDQIFMDLRRIARLFNEKPWKYGPIYQICSRFMSKSDRLLGKEEKGVIALGSFLGFWPGLAFCTIWADLLLYTIRGNYV
ncbi:MAG: hypothetical protein KJ804_11340 [Proteobacteria bacterium]|nr:hypothetical protein [Pseudomonadota bacterium]MBU1058900.1 hypothetical protein [Pseudomonadota bacterium]